MLLHLEMKRQLLAVLFLQVTGKAVVEDIAINGSTTDFAGERGQIGNCEELVDPDFNNLVESGCWHTSGSNQVNPPSGQIGGILIVVANKNKNYVLQLWSRTLSSDNFFLRTLHGNESWQPWRRVFLDVNADSTTIFFDGSKFRAKDIAIGGVGSDLASERGLLGSVKVLPDDVDLDTVKTQGFYKVRGSRAKNSPNANIQTLLVFYPQDGMVNQLTLSIAGYIYHRSFSSGAWTEWKQLAEDREVVHLVGDETIDGIKTFTHSLYSNGGFIANGTTPFQARYSDLDVGSTPSENKQRWIVGIFDKNNKALGYLKYSKFADGRQSLQLLSRYERGDGSYELTGIAVGHKADGTFYSDLPHPVTDSNDNSIATTGWAVGKQGNRGQLSGYETPVVQSTALTVNGSSRDSNLVTGAVKITVSNGAANQSWTKTVAISNASATISLGSSWKWYGGAAPDVSANCVLVLHWCSTFGLASLLVTS